MVFLNGGFHHAVAVHFSEAFLSFHVILACRKDGQDELTNFVGNHYKRTSRPLFLGMGKTIYGNLTVYRLGLRKWQYRLRVVVIAQLFGRRGFHSLKNCSR